MVRKRGGGVGEEEEEEQMLSVSMLPLPVLHIITTMLLLITTSPARSESQSTIAKPGCKTHCGDVRIPYPFGIGPGCYFDEWYQIDCLNLPRNLEIPYLRKTNLKLVENISREDRTLKVLQPITFMNCPTKQSEMANLTGSPFVFSQKRNKFTAVNCGMLAFMRSATESKETNLAACMSICDKNTSDSSCNGMNCCQTTIPSNLKIFVIEFDTFNRRASCEYYAFLVDQQWFESRSKRYDHIIARDKMDSVPVVLEWNLLYNHSRVKEFQMGISDKVHSYCQLDNTTSSVFNQSMIQCFCKKGFEGNPYLHDGCKDINECEKLPSVCKDDICNNHLGGYSCTQKAWKKPTTKGVLQAVQGTSISSGLLLLFFCSWFLYKVMKKRRKIKRKQKFFKRNGGLLLKQQLCSSEVNVETIKVFNSKELEKATDRFHKDRILGHGGQGTVYKGMLTDGRIVAVKKSKIVDESKLAQFINEVIILSQINHINVVRLLGCCLETEVPLLVYKFIPNGTLSKYIHDQNEEFPLTWEMRLRIATEIAGALSYLHYAASFPIYHRDIKSSNILLDEKYKVKIADFGTSRSVSINQTHLTTLVHGTLGYLDPKYFQSSQFTEKSDVYSFGVVLVELLTGQRAISIRRSEEAGKSLATFFILSMQKNRLFDILDPHVLKGKKEDIMVFANLAMRCLNLNGRKRPTMKEVTAELERIQMSEKNNFNVPQDYEEVEDLRTQDFEPWELVSLSTGPASDTGPASSSYELPLLSCTS